MKEIARDLMLALFATLVLANCGKAPEPPAASPPATATPASAAQPEPAPTGDSEKSPQPLRLVGIRAAGRHRRLHQGDRHQGHDETTPRTRRCSRSCLRAAATYDLIQPSRVHDRGARSRRSCSLPLDHRQIPNMKNIGAGVHEPAARSGPQILRAVDGRHGRHRREHREGEGRRSRATRTSSRTSTKAGSSSSTTRARSSRWALATHGHRPERRHADENLAKVKPVLAKWLPLVKVFDSDSPKTALAQRRRRPRRRLERRRRRSSQRRTRSSSTSLPAEGAHMFIDSLAIPKTRQERRRTPSCS